VIDSYADFSRLIKRAVIGIDRKAKTESPNYLKFKEDMKSLFNDNDMFMTNSRLESSNDEK